MDNCTHCNAPYRADGQGRCWYCGASLEGVKWYSCVMDGDGYNGSLSTQVAFPSNVVVVPENQYGLVKIWLLEGEHNQ